MSKLVTVLIFAALLADSALAAANDVKCVRFRDIQAFSKVSDNVLLAQTKTLNRKTYEIQLADHCDYDKPSGNYFITRDSSVWECLEPGDTLRLNLGGSCVVSEIREVTPPTH